MSKSSLSPAIQAARANLQQQVASGGINRAQMDAELNRLKGLERNPVMAPPLQGPKGPTMAPPLMAPQTPMMPNGQPLPTGKGAQAYANMMPGGAGGPWHTMGGARPLPSMGQMQRPAFDRLASALGAPPSPFGASGFTPGGFGQQLDPNKKGGFGF